MGLILPVSGQRLIKQPVVESIDKIETSSADPETTCQATKIDMSGNSATSGSYGNIRTFTVGGFSVKASAFSRRKSDALWETAFLGAFSPGLGVTDRGEGDGGNDRHRVDNVGDRLNYVLFEFNQPVILDQV